MERVTLQINTNGAWRNVCTVDMDAGRRAELVRHLSALRAVLGDAQWSLQMPSGYRDYLKLPTELVD